MIEQICTQIKEDIMPAKPSGEIKTKIVPVPQKNGDIYLMERKTQYDPVKNTTGLSAVSWCPKFQKVKKIRCLPDQKHPKDTNQKQSQESYPLPGCVSG